MCWLHDKMHYVVTRMISTMFFICPLRVNPHPTFISDTTPLILRSGLSLWRHLSHSASVFTRNEHTERSLASHSDGYYTKVTSYSQFTVDLLTIDWWVQYCSAFRDYRILSASLSLYLCDHWCTDTADWDYVYCWKFCKFVWISNN